jgi:hypothetical protein
VLEAVFILLEFPSPSRRIFIGSHSLPPSLVRRIGPSMESLIVEVDVCHKPLLKASKLLFLLLRHDDKSILRIPRSL